MTLWGLMLACGVLTFLIRLSFIAAEGRVNLPGWFRDLLPFVPIAALTALVTPDLLLVGGALAWGADNPRWWSGLVAVAVAARWRSPLATIGAGFAAFYLLRALG